MTLFVFIKIYFPIRDIVMQMRKAIRGDKPEDILNRLEVCATEHDKRLLLHAVGTWLKNNSK